MTPLIIIGAVVGVLAIFLLYRFLKPGYRGAIGFKNRHAAEIATLSLTGFPKAVECRTLARGEHSFNYLGPQTTPTRSRSLGVLSATQPTGRLVSRWPA